MHTGYVAVIAFFGGCIVTRQLFCSNTAVTGPGVDPQEGVYRQYQNKGVESAAVGGDAVQVAAAIDSGGGVGGGTTASSDCAAFVDKNMPRGRGSQMFVHHWFTASRTSCKWNEDARWSPGLTLPTFVNPAKPACNIWYVGAHVEGGDGIELQNMFGCAIHVFEPHPQFFQELSNNWKRKKIPRATLHNFGLGGDTRTVHNIAAAGVNTFVMEDGDKVGRKGTVSIQIRAFSETWKELIGDGDGQMLDLLHVNCEGCEWEMMELLLAGGFAAKIKIIQWGSHWFDGVKNIEERYCKITEGLAKTHYAEFQQPFGWERWIRTETPVPWQAPPEYKCSHAFSLNPGRHACCLP